MAKFRMKIQEMRLAKLPFRWLESERGRYGALLPCASCRECRISFATKLSRRGCWVWEPGLSWRRPLDLNSSSSSSWSWRRRRLVLMSSPWFLHSDKQSKKMVMALLVCVQEVGEECRVRVLLGFLFFVVVGGITARMDFLKK